MEETGILENPALLSLLLPHFEPGRFWDLTSANEARGRGGRLGRRAEEMNEAEGGAED